MGDIYDEINEKYYKDEDNKPMNPVVKRIGIAILILFVLFVLFYNFRSLNLKLNLKKYYQEKFTVKEFELRPTSKASLEDDAYGKLPDKQLFYFYAKDSNNENCSGYADVFGNVIFDSYAETYYHNEIKNYFIDTVDFKNDYPDLNFYIMDLHYSRYVLTNESTTFDGFLHSSCIIRTYNISGYPTLRVVLDSKDYETVTSIKKKLRRANFPIYVEFSSVSKVSPDMYDVDVIDQYEYELGMFFPFGDRYDYATMDINIEKYSELLRSKYETENKVVATVQITENNKIQTNYIIFGDGTLEIRNYESDGNTFTTSIKTISAEDYIDLLRFYSSNYADIHQTVKDDSNDNDLKANLYLHRGNWIWGLIELDHLDNDFDVDFEREDFDYCTDENPARKLYSVKKDNEEIKPVIDILEKYCD